MIKNDISHLCQFSQNIQWLRSSFDTDSGRTARQISLSFLTPISWYLKQVKMTRNFLHLCQFSQNFQQLRSILNKDSATCVDRSVSHFSDTQPAFKVSENDEKNDISHLCQFSQNLQWLRSSFDIDSGGQLDRLACHFSHISWHLKQVKMTFHICVNFLKTFSS